MLKLLIVFISFILYFTIAFITIKFSFLFQKKSIQFTLYLYRILEKKFWEKFVISIILILLILSSFLIYFSVLTLLVIFTIFLDNIYKLGENGRALVLGVTGIYNFIFALKIFYYDARKDEEFTKMLKELEKIFKTKNPYF